MKKLYRIRFTGECYVLAEDAEGAFNALEESIGSGEHDSNSLGMDLSPVEVVASAEGISPGWLHGTPLGAAVGRGAPSVLRIIEELNQ